MRGGVEVLLLEDDPALNELIVEEMEAQGHRVTAMHALADAAQWLATHRTDLIVTDLRLPDGDGMDLLKTAQALSEPPAVIVVTAFGSVRQAVKALQAGADDFLTKPLDLEHLLLSTRRVLSNRAIRSELQQFRQLNTDHGFHGLYGKSPAVKKLFMQIQMLAKAQGPVLILGESGTGKELVARAVHAESPRAGKPFLAVNCAGIPAELLESEFFGHASGSFTGAKTGRKGLLQQADGGTLLLDEIGEMPIELQAKLLRVLETSEYIPVGDTTPKKSNFRLIAATNRDLKTESDEHRFRSDLYFRLNIFEIKLPSLRERIKDIAVLTNHFVKQFSEKTNKKTLQISDDFLQKLENYSWPGNIRELKNVIERSVILSSGDTLTSDVLPYEMQHQSEKPTKSMSAFSMQSVEKLHIQKVLNYTKGNKAETARLLEIGIATLYRKLEEYGIQ